MSSPCASEISDYLNSQMQIIQNTLKDKFRIDINLDDFSGINTHRITFDIDQIDEKHLLKKKNLIDLKNICKQYGLRYSGKKEDLINRIWGVKYPDQAPEDSKPKKRGRKTKVNNDFDSAASSPRVQSAVSSPRAESTSSGHIADTHNNNENESPVSSAIDSAASSPISP